MVKFTKGSDFMLEKFNKALEEEMISEYNQKIEKDESLDSYLNSFHTDDLFKLYLFYAFERGKYDEVEKIEKYSKKKLVTCIKKDLEDIVCSVVRILDDEKNKEIKELFKDTNYIEVKPFRERFDLFLPMFLRNYSLAKMSYDKGILCIFIQEEIAQVLRRTLDDQEIISSNIETNKIYNFIIGIVNAYGIIPIDKVYEILIDNDFKLTFNELTYILECKMLVDERVHIHHSKDDGKILVCGIEFDEENLALDFYSKMQGNYKKFTKKEYEMFYNDTYIETLNSYKELVKYLEYNYDIEDISVIKDLLILDYVEVSQLDSLKANNNLEEHIKEFFEVDKLQLGIISSMIKNVYAEYPKWSKKGDI